MTDIAELDLSHAGRRIEGHGLEAWIEESSELLKLAAPLALTQLAQMAIGVTDTVMLGRFSKTALAAAVLGNTVFFFCWIIGQGPTAAVSPLIAHVLGARPNDRANVRAITRMGFWSVAIASLPLMLVMLSTRQILLALGQRPELAEAASRFVIPLAFGLPFSLGFQVLRNFATALGRPNATLTVMAITVVFNIVGDYALIFGHFGAPRLGILGSGTASASSFLFSFVVMAAVIALTPKLRAYRIFRRFHRPDWSKLIENYRLGMPMGVTLMFEAGLFFSANLIMGSFGTAYVAAHAISMNVPSITFMVPLGVAMAATVRVGLAAGARDEAGIRRAGYSAMTVAIIFMAACAVVMASFPREIASLYLPPSPENLAVIALAVSFLRVAAAFQVFDGLQVTAALSLRGLKDARAPMWIAGGSYWLAGFPVCIALGFGLGMRGLGIWIGMAFGLLVAAVALTARFYYLARSR
ncbi:MAG: MATE family efflux transporter [Alphaproteobacteria bacterium]|nr:MATE family efflux transporter [Alphaproteobacteria bacterium]